MGSPHNKFEVGYRFPGWQLIQGQCYLNGASNPLTGSSTGASLLSGVLGPLVSGSQLKVDSLGQNGGLFGQPVRQGNGYGPGNGTGSIFIPFTDTWSMHAAADAWLIQPAVSASVYAAQVVFCDAAGVAGHPGMSVQVYQASGSTSVAAGTPVDLTQNQAVLCFQVLVSDSKAGTGR